MVANNPSLFSNIQISSIQPFDASLLLFLSFTVFFLFLLLPVMMYLMVGLRKRREEILAAINEQAIALYFQQFHPSMTLGQRSAKQAFREYYAKQFGSRGFIIPFLILAVLLGTLLYWSAWSVLEWLGGSAPKSGHLPALAVVAIAGAYMYCAFDVIDRWNSSGLSPTDLLWLSFRLIIAVPMAYALASAFNPALAVAVAFLVGAFPTKTLLKIARRFASKKLDSEQLPESGDTELLKLPGIDRRIAESFAAEGVTTVVQLAYSDPVRLAIRTNFGFSYMVDVMSQALLYIYVGSKLTAFANLSLRGAYELCALRDGLRSPEADQAERRLVALATALDYPLDVFRNLVSQVGDDPFTQFLYKAWG